MLKKELNVDINHGTISRWAKEYGWDETWIKATKAGLTLANKDTQPLKIEPIKNGHNQTKNKNPNSAPSSSNPSDILSDTPTSIDGSPDSPMSLDEEKISNAIVEAVRQRRMVIVQQLNFSLRWWLPEEEKEKLKKKGKYIPKSFNEAFQMYKFNMVELKEFEPLEIKQIKLEVESHNKHIHSLGEDLEEYEDVFRSLAKHKGNGKANNK